MTVVESVENAAGPEFQIAALRQRGIVALSEREIEVLLAWFASDSKEGAARLMFISPATVATHIARVRGKYAGAGRSARTKTALFARFLEDGYTSLWDW
ncbi:LuxR family transcriptional regulator [Tsukamurella asaccharolytica]|uniref:LuxR family transcriptional regulator n=1 Tax=Tsukamurella asaccharolytica TaxID=2592067 RepID=A0A5C5R8T4_9ACTN|nr:LuxR C-terminal-related transcriptional regulator [Tsukamurella asaccharolytica]TWS18834.1 LuxR family transcriptional regulator [Tsukamurella asaccharolytica]